MTEALLAECAVYFRPAHLQDIVIERSEAESKCGWPVCGNALVLSRRLSSHSLAFGLSDEEEPYRFCSRACMAVSGAFTRKKNGGWSIYSTRRPSGLVGKLHTC